ncbi:MAG: hypothetical protein CL678_16670 [Bdellovibrionaceae bacterium]|nr:hypothetical protein [Pseudobdellovibrionaceae bacterium]
MQFALVSIGPPSIARQPDGLQTLTAAVLPDDPYLITLWGQASLNQPSARDAVYTVIGTVIKSEPLHTGPLCYTIGTSGHFIVARTPIKHTIRDSFGQLCTVAVGVPPGFTHQIPRVIDTRPHAIHIDAIHSELPLQLDVVCNGCNKSLPLRIGGWCARCIMVAGPARSQ